ncbi:hypothetical protein Scep_029789 [Stephania cephalantha]|uniref:Uncharacterized protein n=1 Tax=Stephania cephalantha TaxID=152367 RepID=A0AAP0E658_9MAGN
MAHRQKSHVLLLMCSGIGVRKSTILKDILKEKGVQEVGGQKGFSSKGFNEAYIYSLKVYVRDAACTSRYVHVVCMGSLLRVEQITPFEKE